MQEVQLAQLEILYVELKIIEIIFLCELSVVDILNL